MTQEENRIKKNKSHQTGKTEISVEVENIFFDVTPLTSRHRMGTSENSE